MLWLERPPIVRWIAAGCLVLVAAWSELTPPPTTSAYFLTEDVPAGTPLSSHHVERRTVPAGFAETLDPEGVAATDLTAGDPLIPSLVTDIDLPPGWMLVEAPVPAHAAPGASATAIVLDGGSAPLEFPAVVVDRANRDPLSAGSGTLAVPPEWLGIAAVAAADGKLVIGVETASR